jgi:hypothetical protein
MTFTNSSEQVLGQWDESAPVCEFTMIYSVDTSTPIDFVQFALTPGEARVAVVQGISTGGSFVGSMNSDILINVLSGVSNFSIT